MTKNLPFYIAGATAIAIAGSVIATSLETKTLTPDLLGSIPTCVVDNRDGNLRDNFEALANAMRFPVDNDVSFKNYTQRAYLDNSGNPFREKTLLPCY